MPQRTQQVEYRVRNADAVVASGRTHRDVIASGAAPRLQDMTVEDVAKQIDSLCNSLAAVTLRLGKAEDRHVAELADDAMPRSSRNTEAKESVRPYYNRVRDRVTSALGDAGRTRYGLEMPGSRSARALASQVETTINLLREDPANISDGIGDPVPTADIADGLAAALAPLNAELDRLITEDRENEQALTHRDRVIAEWTMIYQGVATTLSGLYHLAGREDLAERIRPTERRTSGLDLSEPDPEAPVTPVDPTAGDPTAGDPTAGDPTGL